MISLSLLNSIAFKTFTDSSISTLGWGSLNLSLALILMEPNAGTEYYLPLERVKVRFDEIGTISYRMYDMYKIKL